MLAAIFIPYGNRTRLDRFIPVSTALLKKKKTARRYACMHACRCLRRSSVWNRSATALRVFPALSCLLSSWSGLLTVAPVFSKVDVFLDKGLLENIQESSMLVSRGRWRPCGWSCRWRRLSVSTPYDRFIKAAVRAWIGLQRPRRLLSLTLFKMNETEKKIEVRGESH